MLNLKKLPYTYGELEPYIDSKTLEIHYDKHHRTYLDNLNKLISDNKILEGKTLEEILKSVNILPLELQRPVINNGGQVYNHNQYWLSMSSITDQKPTGVLFEKIVKTWGSYEAFLEEWKKNGLAQFGSGWVFLIINDDNKLEIQKTSNADSPIFRGITPILTMDVWEHAYYLKYQNKRAEYIDNYFKVIDWSNVAKLYSELIK
jgi:superoxide dismutase, Fe-Mn family